MWGGEILSWAQFDLLVFLTKTRSNEHNWTPVKYLNVLQHNSSCNIFSLDIAKILPTSYFGYLDMSGDFHQN